MRHLLAVPAQAPWLAGRVPNVPLLHPGNPVIPSVTPSPPSREDTKGKAYIKPHAS